MREIIIKTNDICLCGSGLRYEECCKGKIIPNRTAGTRKQFLQDVVNRRNNYPRKCLHPKKDECSIGKTNSHTISKKAVLYLLAEDGKVLMPVFNGLRNELIMEPMGVTSKASTFYCFCSTHDSMFNSIDKRNVELNDKSFFLYAYRIFASTYYKTMRENDCFDYLSQIYDLTYHPILINFFEQIKRNLPALVEHKKIFDNAIINNEFNCLESTTIILQKRLYFAAATCFCPMFDLFGNPILYDQPNLPMIYFSVIPNESQTLIVFSWLKQDHILFKSFHDQLDISPMNIILKYLNNLLPLNCENLTISPILWEKWDSVARNDFLSVSCENLIEGNKRNVSQTYFKKRKYNLFMNISSSG